MKTYQHPNQMSLFSILENNQHKTRQIMMQAGERLEEFSDKVEKCCKEILKRKGKNKKITDFHNLLIKEVAEKYNIRPKFIKKILT